MLTGPLKLLAAPSTNVPVPALVNPSLPAVSVIVPPTVSVPPFTVTVRTVPPVTVEVTAPVPKFKSLGPLKVTSAFQFWVGLETSVTVWPLVFPKIPPLIVWRPGAQGGVTVHIQRACIAASCRRKNYSWWKSLARVPFFTQCPAACNAAAAVNRVIAGAVIHRNRAGLHGASQRNVEVRAPVSSNVTKSPLKNLSVALALSEFFQF